MTTWTRNPDGTFNADNDWSPFAQPASLDALLGLGEAPLRVNPDGTLSDNVPNTYVTEVLYGTDEADLARQLGEPWSLLRGFSGQHGYAGPVMHASEFIGGGLETHILTNPGIYVALSVDDYSDAEDDSEPIGWVVAHIPN
jgi:hypothetical protein